MSLEIHGYAIVCRKDCIADAAGNLPPALMNEADWSYFQKELDRADVTILGRKSHEAAPNPKRRRRIVVSGEGPAFVEKADAAWWNPAQLPWQEMVDRLALGKSRVAVPGGQGVFELFLAIGYAAFHLSRAHGVALEGGRKVLAGAMTADQRLRQAGLLPGSAVAIDPAAGVDLTVYRAKTQAPLSAHLSFT